jgi:phage replication O-like protein O
MPAAKQKTGPSTCLQQTWDLKAQGDYTPVMNTIAERLCLANLSAHEGRIVWALLRKTFGYCIDPEQGQLRKTFDRISLSQFQQLTGLDRRRACQALTRLCNRRIVQALPAKRTEPKIYGINANVAEWSLSYVDRTAQKQQKEGSTVLCSKDSAVLCAQDSLSYPARTALSYVDAPTKERKEISKENLKEEPPSAGFFFIPDQKKSAPDKAEVRALSQQRNAMARSKLYSETELSEFLTKSLLELKQIHETRQDRIRVNKADGLTEVIAEPQKYAGYGAK